MFISLLTTCNSKTYNGLALTYNCFSMGYNLLITSSNSVKYRKHVSEQVIDGHRGMACCFCAMGLTGHAAQDLDTAS